MQKPLKSNEKRLSREHLITRIVPQSTTENQVISEISHYIDGGSFTEAFDLVEKRGIAGDVALFIVATLQVMGREAV